MGELWLKLDTANPTHSFKDRVVAVACAKAQELGLRTLACSSTGNLAGAVAARAAVEGVRERMRHEDVDALFDEEFPWYVDETLPALATAGFTGLVAEQLSELSWGLAARRT